MECLSGAVSEVVERRLAVQSPVALPAHEVHGPDGVVAGRVPVLVGALSFGHHDGSHELVLAAGHVLDVEPHLTVPAGVVLIHHVRAGQVDEVAATIGVAEPEADEVLPHGAGDDVARLHLGEVEPLTTLTVPFGTLEQVTQGQGIPAPGELLHEPTEGHGLAEIELESLHETFSFPYQREALPLRSTQRPRTIAQKSDFVKLF